MAHGPIPDKPLAIDQWRDFENAVRDLGHAIAREKPFRWLLSKLRSGSPTQ